MEKIFGIGWAKTGTTTLGQCLKILGYKHQSRRLDLVEDLYIGEFNKINALLNDNDSFDDWPWSLLYKKLDEEFPESKFILTIRQSNSWLSSYKNMLKNQGAHSERLIKIRNLIYGFPCLEATDEQLVNRYKSHNQEVIDFFLNKKEKLLIINWEKGDGWLEICNFLNKDVPSIPLPHVNRGKYNKKYRKFINRIKKTIIGDIK